MQQIGRCGVNTNEKVDLTDVNTIEFQLKADNNYGTGLTGTCYGGVYTSSDNSLNFTKVQSYSTNQPSIQDKTLILDVSDLSGAYYIKTVSLHGASPENYQFDTYIYSIKLIK